MQGHLDRVACKWSEDINMFNGQNTDFKENGEAFETFDFPQLVKLVQ